MAPVMGSLNDWHLVKITEKKDGVDRRQVALLFQDALECRETEIESEIEHGRYGILMDSKHKRHNPNGYQLVEYLGEPLALQEETVLYGCGEAPMPVRTMAVKVKFWERLPNQSEMKEGEWFEKPELNLAKRIVPPRELVWLRDLLMGSVEHQNPGKDLERWPI